MSSHLSGSKKIFLTTIPTSRRWASSASDWSVYVDGLLTTLTVNPRVIWPVWSIVRLVPSGPIWRTDCQNMTFWTNGLAVMIWLLVGRLRGLAKSSRYKSQPKYLRDAIKSLIFYHSHSKKLLVVYSAVTHNFLFQINEDRHMVLQKCHWEINNEKGKANRS